MEDFPLGDLTGQIIGAAIQVHTALGPGLLESAYETCLCHDLESLGLEIERRVRVPLTYHGVSLNAAYEMDLLVADEVIVEIKAVEKDIAGPPAAAPDLPQASQEARRPTDKLQCPKAD